MQREVSEDQSGANRLRQLEVLGKYYYGGYEVLQESIEIHCECQTTRG